MYLLELMLFPAQAPSINDVTIPTMAMKTMAEVSTLT